MSRPRKSSAPLSPLALNVRKQRKERGWTQDELARRMKATITYISRIETDVASPSYQFIQKLSGILGITPDALNQSLHRTTEDIALDELIGQIRGLHPKARKDVTSVVQNLMDGFAMASVSYKRAR